MNLNKIGLTLQAIGLLHATETSVFAHGVDELPGLGRDITVILSVVWIIIALGVVFLIRRLIQRGASKDKGTGREPERNTNEPK